MLKAHKVYYSIAIIFGIVSVLMWIPLIAIPEAKTALVVAQLTYTFIAWSFFILGFWNELK